MAGLDSETPNRVAVIEFTRPLRARQTALLWVLMPFESDRACESHRAPRSSITAEAAGSETRLVGAMDVSRYRLLLTPEE